MKRMVSLHEMVASLLDRTGVLDVALQLRHAARRPTVSIVTFHRLAEAGEVADGPYDPDVVDATPEQFRRRVETLARIGTPIGIEALIRALDGGELPPNPVMITFDDGYRSCREIALPILRRLGVPATFFIPTAFPQGRALFWWEQIAVLLHTARGRVGQLAYPYPLRIEADDPGARRRLDDIVKDTPGLDLARFLEGVRAALAVPWSPDREAALAAPLVMGWDDIRALADAGMDIESHTRTHRVLETLSPDAVHEELAGSRCELEVQLGRPVRAIAYPVGRRPPAWIRRAAAAAGYRLGLTNATGVNDLAPTATPERDPFELRRLATGRSHSDAMFLSQIALPQLETVRRWRTAGRAARPPRGRPTRA